MYRIDETLVIIPARSGSKGIPGKNAKLLSNKPLISYTLEAARNVFKDEQICVSTDCEKIIKIVEKTGIKIPFVRPSSLATDITSSYDVIRHAYTFYLNSNHKISTIVLLQPTSPFRTSKHILEAMNLYSKSIDMVVSVKESKANPYYNLFEENEKGWLEISKPGSFTRRQDCPKVWEYNGAIYIINVKSLLKSDSLQFKNIKKYIMDEYASFDIDSFFDWKMAELLMNQKIKK